MDLLAAVDSLKFTVSQHDSLLVKLKRVRERVSRSFWTILLKNQACPIRDARTSSPNDASRAVSGREGGRGGWMDRPQDGVTNNMELISVFPQLCNLCKHLTNTQCSKYTGGFN